MFILYLILLYNFVSYLLFVNLIGRVAERTNRIVNVNAVSILNQQLNVRDEIF